MKCRKINSLFVGLIKLEYLVSIQAKPLCDKTSEMIVSPTDVVGKEVRRETLGSVAERCVVVRVAAEDEQGATEEHG